MKLFGNCFTHKKGKKKKLPSCRGGFPYLFFRELATLSESWFNGRTRAARQECRKAECRWKKDKLQVSRQILKDCWCLYQSTVKEARRKHLSEITESNSHNPRVLFKTIESVLDSPQPVCTEESPEMCNSFLHFFIDN